jgi:hypothetical protein
MGVVEVVAAVRCGRRAKLMFATRRLPGFLVMPVKLMAGLACSSAVSQTFDTVLRNTCPPDDHMQVLEFQLNGPEFQKLVLPRSRALPPGCLNDAQELGFQSLLRIFGHMTTRSAHLDHQTTHTKLVCFPLSCADGLTAIQVHSCT